MDIDDEIIEDFGPLPDVKTTQDTFADYLTEKNKQTNWFNRDGRNNAEDPFIKREMEKLLDEHEKLRKLKEDKTGEMESIEFKVHFVKIYSNDEPEEIKETKRPKIKFDDLNKLPEK